MNEYSDTGSGGEGPTVEPDPPKPELEKAVAHLARVRPGGLVALTAIPPDGGPTKTETFGPGEETEALQWLEDRTREGMNLYWTVNPTRGRIRSKARKEHIEDLAWLHVDLDARPGVNLAEAKAAAIEALRSYRDPQGEPCPPTLTLDSGGGAQGFWRLRDSLYIGGNKSAAEEAEAYSRQIEADFSGHPLFLADACHNCDRVMRLPGTINRPNKKKRDAGRVPVLASVIEYDEERDYPLGIFEPAQPRRGDNSLPGKASTEPHPEPVRLEDTAELDQWGVGDDVKTAIVYGCDPDDKTHWSEDRSDLVFYVCCELYRCGVPSELIVGIITDERWDISAHVIEKGKRNVLDYAWRQFDRAKANEDAKAEAPAVDARGKRILDPTDPYQTALRLRGELFPDAIHTNDDWLEWRSGAYRVTEDETVKSLLWKELDEAKVRVPQKQGPPTLDRFKPNRAKVGEIVAAMQGIVHQPADTMAPPVWLDGDGPPPLEIVALRNGLLHVPTGELLPPTPRFYTRNALDLDFDPNVPEPMEWLAFVEDVLPDSAARDLLQDFMGYLLVPDVSQQKILLMVGPPRAGKGVTQRIITQLVGEGNTCSPLSGDLANAGVGMMQPLIGKTVAFMSDARFGRHAHGHAVTEKLLTISGGDNITISRKHKDAWTGQLPTRFVMLSNELPGLRDNSPALANRFVPLLFEKSFLGREDPTLADRIIGAELPGILNWTLDGWRRLRERGRFLLPRASQEAIEEILELGSPVAAFVRQFCILGPEKRVDKRMLFAKWKEYRKESDEHAGSLEHFARDLYAATNSKVRSVRETEGERSYSFAGIALRDFGDPY